MILQRFSGLETLIAHTIIMGQQVRSGLTEWFWLRVSHELVVQVAIVVATVIRRSD